ncbi:MAG TPA: hypothetical protein VGM54_09870 [Chthoniobacter sp.]|jgi:hypothetical protein
MRTFVSLAIGFGIAQCAILDLMGHVRGAVFCLMLTVILFEVRHDFLRK